MKKIFEGLKDILYDSIDYIIMIGIIGIVVFIIGWRLDLLFAKDAFDIPPEDNIPIENNVDDKPTPIVGNQKDGQTVDENDVEKPDDSVVETIPEKPEEPIEEPSNGKVVKINIPPGSLPSKIGTILESSGVVSSKGEFVKISQELKLDTKLKSGNFEIVVGTPIEEIVKLIAK